MNVWYKILKIDLIYKHFTHERDKVNIKKLVYNNGRETNKE